MKLQMTKRLCMTFFVFNIHFLLKPTIFLNVTFEDLSLIIMMFKLNNL